MTMTDPKQDVQDVRAQFEAWVKDERGYTEWGISNLRLENGYRFDSDLYLPWMAYTAALQSPAVRELVEAAKASVAEIERLRDAMFRVYSTAANGGKTTKAIEAMRDEMDKPWSVDRSLTALRTLGAGHVE